MFCYKKAKDHCPLHMDEVGLDIYDDEIGI